VNLFFKIYVLPLGDAFFSSSQNDIYILMWEYKIKIIFYMVCNMGFENKAYGLNLLVVP
jgi:hypothetical protein